MEDVVDFAAAAPSRWVAHQILHVGGLISLNYADCLGRYIPFRMCRICRWFFSSLQTLRVCVSATMISTFCPNSPRPSLRGYSSRICSPRTLQSSMVSWSRPAQTGAKDSAVHRDERSHLDWVVYIRDTAWSIANLARMHPCREQCCPH